MILPVTVIVPVEAFKKLVLFDPPPGAVIVTEAQLNAPPLTEICFVLTLAVGELMVMAPLTVRLFVPLNVNVTVAFPPTIVNAPIAFAGLTSSDSEAAVFWIETREGIENCPG